MSNRVSPYSYPGLKFDNMTGKQRFYLKNTGKKPLDEFILEEVGKYFFVTVQEIKTRTRVKNIAHARHMYFYLCKKFTRLTLNSISDLVGGYDHTAVINGINKIEGLVKVDCEVRTDAQTIENIIYKFIDNKV